MQEITLLKGKEKAVLQNHPWVFSGALADVKQTIHNGEIIRLNDSKNNFLAYGFYNAESRVAVRVLSRKEEELPEETFWRNRIKTALKSRENILNNATNSCRLIFSEADFLPGLIVDKYAGYLSVQISSSGIEHLKPLILDELISGVNPTGIFDKSDLTARLHEGMLTESGLLWGKQPPEFITIKENNIVYEVNIAEGQKSGFYCDQRENRQILASFSKGKNVLDCFCYSGGFTLNCFAAGAKKVTSVDSSALAIETLKRNTKANNFEEKPHEAIQADVNKQLRVFKEAGKVFDIVVLDPPKYAPSRSKLDKAARAYKDLNRLAMQLLPTSGLLATFSCSGAVDLETFKQIIAWAALDAGKEVQFIHQFSQPQDHPVRASFPEGEYLKGLLCRVF